MTGFLDEYKFAMEPAGDILVLEHPSVFCRHRGTIRVNMLSTWQEASSAPEQMECSRSRFTFRSNRAS
jgi:hypothetical protein